MPEALAAFTFIVTVLAIVFGAVMVLRYLEYKETLELADRGIVRPQHTGNGKGALRWGIVITALGLAMTCGLYPLGWSISEGTFPLNFGPWMLLGLLPLSFGLALLVIYALTRANGGQSGETVALGDAAQVVGDESVNVGLADGDGAEDDETAEAWDGAEADAGADSGEAPSDEANR